MQQSSSETLMDKISRTLRKECHDSQGADISSGITKLLFGTYPVPMNIEEEGLTMSVKKDNRGLIYRRETPEKTVKKIILSDCVDLIIHPVEPLNTPKELTQYFLFEFKHPMKIPPGENRDVYVTFPVEFGVFVKEGDHTSVIDIFSLAKQKFTLYGDVKRGLICKYWKTEIYEAVPSNELHEGIMKILIHNTVNEWVELTKLVLNGYGMKLFYGRNIAYMKANLRILAKGIAETTFELPIPEAGLDSALEMYPLRKLSMATKKFVMEGGI